MGNETKRKGAGDWSTGKSRGQSKAVKPDEILDKAEEYLANCTEESRPTRYGLFKACGFKTKQSFYDYKKDPDYAGVLEQVEFMIEGKYEQQLANGRGDGGIVFALKQYGWNDKQQIDHTTGGQQINTWSVLPVTTNKDE